MLQNNFYISPILNGESEMEREGGICKLRFFGATSGFARLCNASVGTGCNPMKYRRTYHIIFGWWWDEREVEEKKENLR